MLSEVHGLTRTRLDLFDLGYAVVDHIEPELITNPNRTLKINTHGTHHCGKSIFRDAIFARIIGITPEEVEYEKREFSGKSHGLPVKGSYFIVKNPSNGLELVFCDLQAQSDDTFVQLVQDGAKQEDVYFYLLGKLTLLEKARTKPGLTVTQNGYGPSFRRADLCIGVEKVADDAKKYSPLQSAPINLEEVGKRGLTTAFETVRAQDTESGVENDWLRVIKLEFQSAGLFASQQMQVLFQTVQQNPIIKRSGLNL